MPKLRVARIAYTMSIYARLSARAASSGVQENSLRIAGGVHGDQATAAIVVNAIPRVVAADPGLLTMADLPVVAAWLG